MLYLENGAGTHVVGSRVMVLMLMKVPKVKTFMCLTQLDAIGRTARAVFLTGALFLLSAATAPQPKNILFLGDSITAGYGLEPRPAYAALIQAKIEAKRWQFNAIYAGQSGDTSAGGLNRLNWLLKNRVDVLLLELGGNDGLRGLPAETTHNNLQAIIDRTKAKYPTVKIVLAGMQVPPNMGANY